MYLVHLRKASGGLKTSENCQDGLPCLSSSRSQAVTIRKFSFQIKLHQILPVYMVLVQYDFCLSSLPPLKTKIYLWSGVPSSSLFYLFFTLRKTVIFGKYVFGQ